MIIKKKNAVAPKPSFDRPSFDQAVVASPPPPDPYQGHLDAQQFATGDLADRRKRTDRRRGFRRIEDQEVISRAHEEANAIREKAYQDGFEEGLNQGAQTLEQLKIAIGELLSARDEALLSVSNDLGQMAIEIAERIIRTEVTCDDELVMTLVKSTIQKVGREQKSILIKVNPVDLRVVKESIKNDSPVSDQVEVLVMEDPSVDQGSCMIETQAGLIDARFSTQLEILKKILATGGKF